MIRVLSHTLQQQHRPHRLILLSLRAYISDPVTPDFTTSIDVDSHKLTRPLSYSEEKGGVNDKKWVGLPGLTSRASSSSLVPKTLQDMKENDEFRDVASRLRSLGQKRLTLEEKKRRRRALDSIGVPSFQSFLEHHGIKLARRSIEVLQVNIGLYCNQACTHCHVESSPKRTEQMTRAIAERCIKILKDSPSVNTLDITGGAPEFNPYFRYLVREARNLGRNVIDRCNLTVLLEPGMEDLVSFLADQRVHVSASLPCYSAKNVNQQRGSEVFDKSIAGILKLNRAGYGVPESQLVLDLVYNPLGAFLPPDQTALETKYKQELWDTFGITFNSLFTITNMPIKRFADHLHRRQETEMYMNLLVRNFNAASVSGIMCTNHLSVRWDGHLFDCDFNQQLDLDLIRDHKTYPSDDKNPLTIFDIQSTDDIQRMPIAVDSHCFGCTAGMGSS